MRLHVTAQVVRLREGLHADVALVRFLVGVRLLVPTEVVGLREGLGAHLALVRPFVGVRGQVPQVAMLVQERPAARATVERLGVAVVAAWIRRDRDD